MMTIALAAIVLAGSSQEASQSMTVEELLNVVGPRLDKKFAFGEEVGLGKRKVTVPLITEKTPKDEMLSILESVMHLSGFAMIPADQRPSLFMVIPVQYITKYPVPVLGVKEVIPAGDGVYTKVFRLTKIGAAEVHQGLINMVTLPQGILPFAGAGMIAITDYASNLRRLAKVIEDLDNRE